MTIRSLNIQGFRSVRNMTLPLSQLNIISGANGCGKSNLYKAVRLLHEAANGRLSQPLRKRVVFKKSCGLVGNAMEIMPKILSE